jgi:RND family efflux transporter MFP subunit
MTTSTQPSRVSSSEDRDRRDALASLRIERPVARNRGRLRGVWLMILGLLLLGGAAFAVYRVNSDAGNQSLQFLGTSNWVPEIMQNRIEVRLASVMVQQGRSADAVVVATGYLESRRQAKIGARAVGRMDQIYFEEGDRVRQGSVIAELEHKDLDASLAAAVASVQRAEAALAEQEIAIEQARVDMERLEQLWKSRSVAESEYDTARFTHRSAVARRGSLRADIALAEAQRAQTAELKENMFIRAPFDGTIISKDAEVGESITPGGLGAGSGRGSVATIADLDHLEIECDVQEDYISRVSPGQEAEISVDAVPHKKYHGRVRKIIPMGDRARATIKVQVAIEDADELLFPEMAGTVFFLPSPQDSQPDDEPRMFCASSAVGSDRLGNQFVWIVDSEKRARKIPVRADQERDGRREILQGLQGGERVVVNPEKLSEGALVQIVE